MKNSIEKIDKNLEIKTINNRNELTFYDACSEKFYISGLIHDTMFRRMPEKTAKAVSESVYALHTHTAGGSVHFETTSNRIAIKCTMNEITHFPHMAATGVCGFDIYVNNEYFKTFVPPVDMTGGYESEVTLTGTEMRKITINFPLYNNVTDLYIGLENGDECKSINPYKPIKQVVFYGSSITQGGCASRPGMSYQAIISRNIGCPVLNLGFSGSGKGERVMAEYISQLEMSVFVLDYDHNAPNSEHLKNTHEPFFKIIRKSNPNLPVIMLCQHDRFMSEAEERRRIIFDTYTNAKNSGDNNVYFINGFDLFPNRDCTVDGCHPTDYGFSFMAEKIGGVIEEILKKSY